jgi:hypothetical protein
LQARLIEEMPEAVRARLPEDHPVTHVVVEEHMATTPTKAAENVGPSMDGLQGFAPPSPSGT